MTKERVFKCATCGKEIIVHFLHPGEVAVCKKCNRSNQVPDDDGPIVEAESESDITLKRARLLQQFRPLIAKVTSTLAGSLVGIAYIFMRTNTLKGIGVASRFGFSSWISVAVKSFILPLGIVTICSGIVLVEVIRRQDNSGRLNMFNFRLALVIVVLFELINAALWVL